MGNLQAYKKDITNLGYTCYQKIKNRKPFIRLTRYLVIKNGMKKEVLG